MSKPHIDKLAIIELFNELKENVPILRQIKNLELLFNFKIENELDKITDKELFEVAQTVKRWVKKYEL